LDQESFYLLVAEAVENLPEEFHIRLENVDVVVEDWPTKEQLTQVGLKRRDTLLGLYQGVPLTERGAYYGLVTPDKITIFQKPIEAKCGQDSDLISEIQRVVKHEIAHHFGIDDTRLQQLENDED
jgi:predicted Zn-dependent protease with MMP-like domain